MLGKLKISCAIVLLVSISYGQSITVDTTGYVRWYPVSPLSAPYTFYTYDFGGCGNTPGANVTSWSYNNGGFDMWVSMNTVWSICDAYYYRCYNDGDTYCSDGIYMSPYITIIPMKVMYITNMVPTTNSCMVTFSGGSWNPTVYYQYSAFINITLAKDAGFTNTVIYNNSYIATGTTSWNVSLNITNLESNTTYYLRIARVYAAGSYCNNIMTQSPYMYYSFKTLTSSNNRPKLQTIMNTR